jgi:hypothetical protein
MWSDFAGIVKHFVFERNSHDDYLNGGQEEHATTTIRHSHHNIVAMNENEIKTMSSPAMSIQPGH